MADTAQLTGSLSAKIDGTGVNIGIAQTSLTRNLATVSEATTGIDTLSTSWQAFSFGAVAWNEVTLLELLNLSVTTGEDITVGKPVVPSTGFTLDGTPTQAGASVPNTLAAAGNYRNIISDGTSQGINWKVGDVAVYLGSSGVWGRIPITEFLLIRGNDVTGFAGPLPVKADGTSWYAKSATGAPRMANIAVGALA
jgi:hypothetical protein